MMHVETFNLWLVHVSWNNNPLIAFALPTLCRLIVCCIIASIGLHYTWCTHRSLTRKDPALWLFFIVIVTVIIISRSHY